MRECGDEKYCLSGNKVASEVLPQAKSAKSCTMEVVEPGTSQVTELVHYQLAKLLGESENWSLCARIEQKGNKGVGVRCSHRCEERAQVGSGGNKDRPGRHSSCGCCCKASALPSDDVRKGTRGRRDATWDLATASGVSAPISSQPAGSISPTRHSQLDSCLLTLKLGGGARGEDRRGTRQGHVGEAKESK